MAPVSLIPSFTLAAQIYGTHMALKHQFRLWVTNAVPVGPLECRIHSESLEDEAAYGLFPHHRKSPGPLLCVNPYTRRCLDGRLSPVHINSQGWFWHLIGAPLPAEPPFLLTDDLDIACIFDGPVRLHGRSLALKFLNDTCDTLIPLSTDRWFGLFLPDVCHAIDTGRLIAFSTFESKLHLPQSARTLDDEICGELTLEPL